MNERAGERTNVSLHVCKGVGTDNRALVIKVCKLSVSASYISLFLVCIKKSICVSAKSTVLIRCTVWCDWFYVSKRTDCWPEGRQSIRFGQFSSPELKAHW